LEPFGLSSEQDKNKESEKIKKKYFMGSRVRLSNNNLK